MNFSIAILLSCLISAPAFAQTGLEYELPASAVNWSVKNQLENENGSMKIFVPQDSEKNSNEFFGVNVNKFPADLDNTAAFKDGLAAVLPQMDIDVQVVEKHQDSVIYEWSAKQEGAEKMHGWGRVFAVKEGTAALCYQTSELSTLEKSRSDWMPVLQKAKAVEKIENHDASNKAA